MDRLNPSPETLEMAAYTSKIAAHSGVTYTRLLRTRRDVLLAAYQDGHSIEAIAQACGISKEAVSRACGRPSGRRPREAAE